ncbi:MAG: 50S ribosomal protein L18 [Gemmatimonadetes bacterium]|nr:50S ribosomal protein L18 [Gemmatimonadota bacterium]
MRRVRKPKTPEQRRRRRHVRVRSKVQGTAERPRLVVFRSLKHIYAHLVDDTRGAVLLGVADRSAGVARTDGGKVAKGFAVGLVLAERAKQAGITRVVFDRAGYAYHGRVKAVADGARRGGLEF